MASRFLDHPRIEYLEHFVRNREECVLIRAKTTDINFHRFQYKEDVHNLKHHVYEELNFRGILYKG